MTWTCRTSPAATTTPNPSPPCRALAKRAFVAPPVPRAGAFSPENHWRVVDVFANLWHGRQMNTLQHSEFLRTRLRELTGKRQLLEFYRTTKPLHYRNLIRFRDGGSTQTRTVARLEAALEKWDRRQADAPDATRFRACGS